MRRWHKRFSHFTPAALALFVASIAVPRSALYFHVHAGGDHIHVHDHDEEGPAHDHDLLDGHHHPHHADELPEIEAPESPELGHWHTQTPFHRVAPATVFRLASVQRIVLLPVAADLTFRGISAVCHHARGPPRSALV